MEPTPQELEREAIHLQNAGRWAEAEAAWLRLLERIPGAPDGWYNLGFVQRHGGRYDAALASYRRALDLGVREPEEVHVNRGVIYSDCLRQPQAAEHELEAALRLNARYLPALLNLANLREDLGQREAALGTYERLLAIAPHMNTALARYAGLRGAEGPGDPIVNRLREAIASPGTTAADVATLGFALGQLLDRCGAWDEAFAAYAAANRASRASMPRNASPYDRARHEAYVDALIATFTRERADAARDATHAGSAPAVNPIFICGMFRSGSTLAEQVLAGHPRVTAGGELEFLPRLVQRQLAPFPASMLRATPPNLRAMAADYLDTLARTFPGADRVTDKRPDNFLYLGLIKTLFPDSRIVHTLRHPLDNCLSVYFLHLDQSMGYALDLLDTGHYYRQYRRLMEHWKSLYGDDILDFDYDAFVRDPRTGLERLLGHCGLEWDENCLQFHRVANSVRTASVWQVREPLYRRSSGRWRNYAHKLGSLAEYLGTRCPPGAT